MIVVALREKRHAQGPERVGKKKRLEKFCEIEMRENEK